MNKWKYTSTIYFIGLVIAATLAIQVYWNYKNYQASKQQLIRDVQTSLDKAVTDYYDLEASSNTRSFFTGINPTHFDTTSSYNKFLGKIDSGDIELQSIIISNDSPFSENSLEHRQLSNVDSLLAQFPLKIDTTYSKTLKKLGDNRKTTFKVSGNNAQVVDSLMSRIEGNVMRRSSTRWSADSLRFDFVRSDSITRLEALQNLTTKIVLSFDNNIINTERLDSLVALELNRKNIRGSNHFLFYASDEQDSVPIDTSFDLKVQAKSALLPTSSTLEVGFKNIAGVVFKRNIVGILLSILLVGAVISSLLYLLKIIRDQKALAEIKNDFISNITHEFKTPIATIGVALESIQHFNSDNDLEKTQKYVAMSSQQVGKLSTMVEKLLDTATLDSKALELNKQETNLYDLLESISQKYRETQEKEIYFSSTSNQVWVPVDTFHLENALDNIIDNAVKYGGQEIKLSLLNTKAGIQIIISDTGNALTKAQASQIFEKFYRVPKGNTHDVKGFGIGLYYTKTIIEKHDGTISVSTQPTTFKITLPYV